MLFRSCPAAPRPSESESGGAASAPRVCGPSCGIATIWSAARDGGWAVEPVGRAVAGIGSLLTGQYDGVLGIARLEDLEKAFAMLPAFSLPVAAVPCEAPATHRELPCAEALAASRIDVEWVLGLLGVAGGEAVPVGDYLPLLREAAEMFTAEGLAGVADGQGLGAVFGPRSSGARDASGDVVPLEATAAMAGDFLSRGGKFLRPFICLAAHDAIRADQGRAAPGAVRDAVKAAAVAIEIFHKASLVHDDIEDQDQMRYGRPTMHVEHGVPAAINAGDYLLGQIGRAHV